MGDIYAWITSIEDLGRNVTWLNKALREQCGGMHPVIAIYPHDVAQVMQRTRAVLTENVSFEGRARFSTVSGFEFRTLILEPLGGGRCLAVALPERLHAGAGKELHHSLADAIANVRAATDLVTDMHDVACQVLKDDRMLPSEGMSEIDSLVALVSRHHRDAVRDLVFLADRLTGRETALSQASRQRSNLSERDQEQSRRRSGPRSGPRAARPKTA